MSQPGLHLWLEDRYGDNVGLRILLRSCLHTDSSPFQCIDVYDSEAFGRILALGGSIALTERDEAIYAEGLAHVAASTHPNPRRALILGGGDGGVARELLRYPGLEHLDVVEIDEEVIAVCRRCFAWTAATLDDPRVEVTIDDAHRFLSADGPAYDLIIVDSTDLYDPSGTAVHTRSLPELIAERLAEGGVVTAPLASPYFEPDRCRNAIEELQQAIDNTQVYQIHLPSQAGGTLCCARAGAGSSAIVPGATVPEGLGYWHPSLHDRLFLLPENLRQTILPG